MATRTKDEGRMWWAFLATGVAGVLMALSALSFDVDSLYTLSVITGVVLLTAGVSEYVSFAGERGWRLPHAVLGVLVIGTGISVFFSDVRTFFILPRLIGGYLMLKGTYDIVYALYHRGRPLAGPMLTLGMLTSAVGFWAISYPGRSINLLLIWVAASAMARGLTDTFVAFQMKSAHDEARAARVTRHPRAHAA